MSLLSKGNNMSRQNEAVILSFDTIWQALRNTLSDERIDKEEQKKLEAKEG